MIFVFRTDASLEIGTGHVMRCLTLADKLKKNSHECIFITRDHIGNLSALISKAGFKVHVLSQIAGSSSYSVEEGQTKHAAWLGVPWEQDATQTLNLLKELKPEWLIVDHYALDARWEHEVADSVVHMLVIDDLADRNHDCKLLLDQNLGRHQSDYDGLVPENCTRLIGPKYALLRPEFSHWRSYSLQRRNNTDLNRLLISLGGVDKENVTGQVLNALKKSSLPVHCEIIVVMGETALWLEEVRVLAKTMPWSTLVKVAVSNMAQLMAESDLAIGAAGTTSWERCALGLPCILLCLAENQKMVIKALTSCGASEELEIRALEEGGKLLDAALKQTWMKVPDMIPIASSVTDGKGSTRVMDYLLQMEGK